MRDDDLETYLGSKHSTLGFFLFALGLAAILAGGIVAATAGPFEKEAQVFWLLPVWGLIAVPLGLSMRRKEPSVPALLLGCALLAIPLGMALIPSF